MRYWKWLLMTVSVLFLASVFSCSSAQIPISPDKQGEFDSSNTTPILALEMKEGIFDEIGLLGAYELLISPSGKQAELQPKRTGSVGESYIVSGKGYFTISPCHDCLNLTGIKLTTGGVSLTFKIRHPFERGDPAQPPSARNRLDLDVFDPAIIVVPQSGTPLHFPGSSVDVYNNVLTNPDGYTTEIANLITKPGAMPYVLIVDNSEMPSPHTWNKFAMGDEKNFDVSFILTAGSSMKFDLYLTMGYGSSATKSQRLNPKYYNPEFNRKAAWKIEVTPSGPWLDTQPLPVNVQVKVYDWQVGATVFAHPDDFANAPSDNVYASSEVENVSIDIPAMFPLPVSQSVPTSGSGMPDDPLIYDIAVPNLLLAPSGTYTGLAISYDVRPPLIVGLERDFLIHTPDGSSRAYYEIPDYATYQIFTATVVHEGIALNQLNYTVGPSPDDPTSVDDSSHGNVDIGFVGKADPQFFNLTVNGDWAVQNIPIISLYGVGAPCCITLQFNLNVPDGVDVTEVMAGWSFEPTTRGSAPPASSFFMVGERNNTMYGGFPGYLGVIPAPDPFMLIPPIILSMIAIRGGPIYNQECDPDQCVPTAVSNSLKYLQDRNGNPPRDKPTDPATMRTACGMSTPTSTAGADWGSKKGTYMNNNGYNVNTTGIPPTGNFNHDATAAECEQAFQAVQNGQDVEMNGRFHCAQIVAMVKLLDGSYAITISHDSDQDDPAGGTGPPQTVIYNPNGTPPKVDGGGIMLNGHALNGFVSEGP